MAKKPKKMTTRQYAAGLFNVAKFSFRAAPGAVGFKIGGILVDAALPVATTYFAAQTINQLTAAYGGDPGAGRMAIIYVIITAGLGLLALAWSSVDSFIQELLRYKVESRVSDMMYEQFLSLDFWQYDDKQTADLYERARKFSQFYAWIFDRLSRVASNLITFIFALAALAVFLPWMALAVLVAVIPGIFLQIRLSRAQAAHWNENVDSRRTRDNIEWNLLQPSAIAELRLNGLARYLMDLRSRLRDKDERGRMEFDRKFIGRNLAADALQAAVEAAALIWIVTQIIAREQPLGQFIYVQQLVSRALNMANGFVYALGSIDEDLVYLFDYQQFMALPTPRESGERLSAAPRIIEFRDVSFTYSSGKQQVLSGVSCTIRRGQHVAVVGENGAGKTTFIKLLTGLYQPTQGGILLDGKRLADINRASWHRQLSVLLQDFQQYGFASIRDNVHFGDVSRPMDQQRVDAALAAAEATEFVGRLPAGQDTLPHTWMEDSAGNKGVSLSGGQWQRLALARNFYRDAPIVILDEPTSAIDALAEARIFDRLFADKADRTIITISHRLTTVEKADIIFVMEDGSIVEQGTHKHLVAKRGAYYKLFERQLTKS